MTKRLISSNTFKSRSQVIFEYVLLAVCLCVIALRATFTEGPTAQSATLPSNLGDIVYSLSVSGILILAFIFWFVPSFLGGRFSYRVTGIEIGLCLFCIGALAAGFTAPNKRTAITDSALLIAPLLMAILLVQILDSQAKIKLVLCVVGALGVVSTYECANQLFHTNQAMIEQYEENPQALLGPLGIEQGSFQQFLFEHRLYTRGVRGFFTTRNSAGSFAMLAFFAATALFAEKLKYRKHYWCWPLWLVTSAIAALAVLLGLAITRSKGAIVGLLFGVVVLVVLLRFGNWLRTHRKAILIACILLAISGICLTASYGLKQGRLPGGSGMLVRWQYWRASVKMYADHPITGVGPGNFTNYYTHYKPAEALESVADPHNFALSILTQYGPVGLAGFLAIIFIPLWKSLAPNSTSSSLKPQKYVLSFIVPAVVYLIVVAAVLGFVKPMLAPISVVGPPGETTGDIILLYMIPVRIFTVGFILLAASWKRDKTPVTSVPAFALFCAVLGVLVHNLIDFAILEPGVYTTFFAIIACLIAIDARQNSRPQLALRPALFAQAAAVVAALLIVAVYVCLVLWPVYKGTHKIRQAYQAISVGRYAQAHDFLALAAECDRLDSTALNMNGRLYMQHYTETGQKQPALLEKARECFLRAIDRNKASFKNYEKLSTVYDLLGETQKAYDSCLEATKRYPGSGRLRFQLAEIAEKLGKNDVAIEQYEKAIEIEDKYRAQFRLIYPEREEIASRIGEEKYQSAKQRIELLSQKPSL